MDNQNPPQKEQSPKQQVTDALKNANNVLVTISRDPSVDQLAACIGLTLMLNKLDKHATAVFSGAIPSTLEFLQPEKTIETNTDSLRDFIISLDKAKADKLRYKVEDNVVRIYITPYRTSISSNDLEFTQGNFNVDVVMALGIENKDDLDSAIIEHGQILHDATVIDLSFGDNKQAEIGAINWHDQSASSLSEMLVSISESFQSGLLDSQMATAFLTGIVAETDRFSNDKTSPKVMTMSAQLMAAGANQQLIANQLAIQPEPTPVATTSDETQVEAPQSDSSNDGELVIEREETEEAPLPAPVEDAPAPLPAPAPADPSETSVSHEDSTAEMVSPEAAADLLGTSSVDVTDKSEHPTEEKVEPSEIEIDEHGNMVDITAQEEEKAYAHKQKVIQPLNVEPPKPKTDLSSYSFDDQKANTDQQPQSTEENAIIPETMGDQPTPEQTLADLEKAVDSPHLAQQEAAREEIAGVIEEAEAPKLDLPAEMPATDQDQQSQIPPAPSVPPPMAVPPYMQPQGDDELNLPSPQ
ncbi:hypothetical protein KC930_01500 [Candidatus Saccharibacteria bacterium]|nr:hypothetical protein [Candidatus Saccharibacteria bacterium]